MAISIHQLIAAISPDTYCEAAKRREVKRLVKEGLKQGNPLTFQRAAAVAKPVAFNEELVDEMETSNAFGRSGLEHPLEHHTLAYDSMDDSLEALYFWLLDWLTQHRGLEVTKLADNSAASPGSGPFQDWSNRLMKMQKEGMEWMTSAQKLVRTILDDVTKLRAQEHLVQLVEAAKTADADHRHVAVEALRRAWVGSGREEMGAWPSESHDLGLGNGDMEDELWHHNRQSLPDWFATVENDVRIRSEIMREQIRNQFQQLKLYARWAKPYLAYAQELAPRAKPETALVTAFNTVVFEVTLLARDEYHLADDIPRSELPRYYARASVRKYHPVLVVELKFRSAPKRIAIGTHAHRGRVEVNFTSYALNDAELEVLVREVQRDEVGDLVNVIGVRSVEHLESLFETLERLVESKPEPPSKPVPEDINPFSALFSGIRAVVSWFFGEATDKADPRSLSADSTVEQMIRSQAIRYARKECQLVVESCKEALHMTSLPNQE